MNMQQSRTSFELDGTWLYVLDEGGKKEREKYPAPDCDRSSWKPMDIPNNWYLTEVGDYDGAVWFSRTFDMPDEMMKETVSLRFNAVDYIAEVWLNGTYLGSHEGYFNPFEFSISSFIRKKDNCLVVRVDSPRDPTEYILVDDPKFLNNPLSEPYKRHWAKDLTIIKGHLIDAMHRPGSMTKYRQDGNTGGIWQAVEIIASGPVRIDYTKIYTKIVNRDFVPDGSGLVTFDLELDNTTQEVQQITAGVRITPENFDDAVDIRRTRKLELQPGKNLFKFAVTIPDVKLWWTWDHGSPDMYHADIWVEQNGEYSDYSSQTFGVKEVKHDDDTGHWYLNGKKIFLRGMRYYSSMYMSEITKERIEKDLKEMLDMDINSIRIGSHVELDDFYTLCDEMGFLVWQNFPLHYCYSDSDDVIERASIMMRDMVRMLHNHASLGMWSVFKEPQIYGLPNMPNNYGRLCEILYETGKTVDPIRWMHKGDYQEGVQNLMTGCTQPGDVDMKSIRLEPNIVEFGTHALPNLESLKKIIPEKDLWPPNWDTWEYWGFFYDLQVHHTKLDLSVDSLEELIEQSQSIEAKTIKEQIEFFRQRKYTPVGSMYLYYWNDAAPMIGSGIVDYFGEKLPAYYSMKSVYTPVLVSLEWNKKPYVIGYEKFWKTGDLFEGSIWAVNDHHRIIPSRLSWHLTKEGSDEKLAEGECDLQLAPDSSTVVDTVFWQVPKSAGGKYIIRMHISDNEGNELSSNYFDFTVN